MELLGTWWKGKAGFCKSFLRADISNLAAVKIKEKAVNKGKANGMQALYAVKFTGSKQMLIEIKEVL